MVRTKEETKDGIKSRKKPKTKQNAKDAFYEKCVVSSKARTLFDYQIKAIKYFNIFFSIR